MTVTQRGQLAPEDEQRLLAAREHNEAAQAAYRDVVLEMVDRSSYREVRRLTGLSLDTLQRWKRESR